MGWIFGSWPPSKVLESSHGDGFCSRISNRKSDLQSNGKNLDVDGFHCDNWVWNSNDPSWVHTRRSGPKETSSPGLKSLVQRAKANRISINLFSWNQVYPSVYSGKVSGMQVVGIVGCMSLG